MQRLLDLISDSYKTGITMRKMLLATGILVCLGVSASVASAAQIRVSPIERTDSFTTVAGRECMRDEKGWHYMDGKRRHDCRPPQPKGKDWGWRCEGGRCGWWHGKEKRWND